MRLPEVLRRRAVVWPLAIAALIFVASSRSQVAGVDISMSDKVVHFCVYGLLATLVCRVGRGWRGAVLGLVVASVYGASDEWHQSTVPGRAAELADWVADTLGAATAVVLYTGWGAYRKLLETPLRWRRARPAAGNAV
ncbi:MAG: hypothetical protein B9S34_10790 [Opitutia bacterium Tous-C1TDCM]|nr:MAG: hypothetical protein B9S34_10790 [Opitutae bacterium Tous-C1TDCM]